MAESSQDTLQVGGEQSLLERQIGRQAKALALQLRGVVEGQGIECVHRSRVASRRLRVALAMLDKASHRKHAKRWKRSIKKITRGLGDARDCDVQIETLESILAGGVDKPAILAISLLMAYATANRAYLQRSLNHLATSFQKSGVLVEIRRAMKRSIAKRTVSEKSTNSRLHKQLEKRFDEHFNNLEQHASALEDAEKSHEHHVMRIAAKRLRYALESARGMYSIDLDAAIAEARGVQDSLGKVHDCDVWLARLEEFGACESAIEKSGNAAPGHAARVQPGIECLRNRFTDDRGLALAAALETWNRWKSTRFWPGLISQLRQNPVSSSLKVTPAIEVA